MVCCRLIHDSFLNPSKTITSEKYAQQIDEMLKQAVKDHNVGSPPKSPTHASPQHTQTGILPITTLCHSPNINCLCVYV